MSANNLSDYKREFAELNFRPDITDPEFTSELNKILEITGLKQEYEVALSELSSLSLIKIVKHVCKVCYSDKYNEIFASSAVSFLSLIYTKYCTSDKVNRVVTKCLRTCPDQWQSQLSAAVSNQFISLINENFDLTKREFFFKTLNECCNDFPDFVSKCIEKSLVYLHLSLQKSYEILVDHNSTPAQKTAAIRCVHQGIRLFLTAERKNIICKTMNILVKLKEIFIDLLKNDKLTLETISNCCLSIIHTHNGSTIECWKMCLDIFSTQSYLVKLGFCGAILNSQTGEQLRIINPDNGESICASIFNIIICACSNKKNLGDISVVISSSRVLLILSKKLCSNSEIDVEKSTLDSLINILWTRMEHVNDSVRHLARETMMNLVDVKDEYILNNILQRLTSMSNCIDISQSRPFLNVLLILAERVDYGTIMKLLPNGCEILLNFTNNSNYLALQVFLKLLVHHYSITDSKIWFDYWLRPLFLKADKLSPIVFELIISRAIDLTPDVSKHINDLSNQNELSLNKQLVFFYVEKKMYLKSSGNENKNWMSQTTYEVLKKSLYNSDEKILFSALNLILDCDKKTQPFTNKELELMKHFITYNIKHEKASIKQKNLAYVKKMLLRMKDSQLSVTVRNDISLCTSMTMFYTEFLNWFSDFCFENLFPDANFSRRNFSLESLHLIQSCLSSKSITKLNEPKNVSLLLNCIWDPYEQNKILAKDILTYKNQDTITLDNMMIEDIFMKSKILASSTSPPDCVTAGYLLEVVIFLYKNINYEEYTYTTILDLIIDLEKEIDFAEKSLTLASAKGPMYGLLHTIRHLLNTLDRQFLTKKDDWAVFINKISTICLKCEKLVSVVINDSSPEGVIPMDDLYQDNCQVTSQMILLCCWRTAKESSLLLGDIVEIIGTLKSEVYDALITDICSCLTLLLSETKHRGAFEQIYVAYSKVCSVMWKSSSLHKIPQKYLENVLKEIETGLGETFCVTRRSAGMPFIIQALICTNHDKWPVVNTTMEILLKICENVQITEDLATGVVHALNVLRALIRCSELGDLVEPFICRAIIISIELFNSSLWPVRNSSTLLLSALMIRVFGVPRSSTELSWKNRMSSQEFFDKYPDLFSIFLHEFEKFSPMDMRPSLYPTLLILARLYPTVNYILPLEQFIPYIYKCAQSPVMKTRMLAATSIASHVTAVMLLDHLKITHFELIKNDYFIENTTHGLLLQMFNLVENMPDFLSDDDVKNLLLIAVDLASKYDKFAKCSYVVQEIYLRTIRCMILYLSNRKKTFEFCKFEHVYTSTLESITKLNQSNAIGRSQYLESAALFLFTISVLAKTDFSIVVYNIVKSNMCCETLFEILSIIFSKNDVALCDNEDQLKSIPWNRDVLMEQLIANKSLIELICEQCTKIDSLTDRKYSILSNFTPALHLFFENYDTIDNFISKVFSLRRDTEISQALLCINGYLQDQKSLDPSIISKLTKIFENIYYAQRSDDCKNACIDIFVNNYNLMIEHNTLDVTVFLRLWTVIFHYSEDDSEEVRNHVWSLMSKGTNCAKSFELLFDKFAELFDRFPSAVLAALICWSYLDIELPQDRPESQVFDGGDTREFKEPTIRRRLALNKIMHLTNSHSHSLYLKISECVQNWIVEEWTSDLDTKPTTENLLTIRDFTSYSKKVYSKISELNRKNSVFF